MDKPELMGRIQLWGRKLKIQETKGSYLMVRGPEKAGKGGLQSMDGESALQMGGRGTARLQPQEL